VSTLPEERDTAGAFAWIATLLDDGGFGWVVVGGLAARTYGSSRPLADIDIDTPRAALRFVAERAREFITFGPERYRDSEFDIELLTLRWGGQDIDLTAAEDIRLFDRGAAVWREVPTDMKAFEIHQLMGRSAPVMSRETLVHYKRIIDRPVDRVDIEAVDHGGVKNRG